MDTHPHAARAFLTREQELRPPPGRGEGRWRPRRQPSFWRAWSGWLPLAVAVVLTALTPGAAAVITVTTTADDLEPNGNCTLREAIQAANHDTAVDACRAGRGADMIRLGEGTFSLTLVGTNEDAAATGDLDMTADVTIRGAGADLTVIQQSADSPDRVLDIAPGGEAIRVVLTGLTVTGGRTSFGAGIRNAGDLHLHDCTVSGNMTPASGGGIANSGRLTLSQSRVTHNRSTNVGGGGGGIYNTGDLLLRQSLLQNNGGPSATNGAGLLNVGGHVVLRDSVISMNASQGLGSGISNGIRFLGSISGGTIVLVRSTVSNNIGFSCGGIDNIGTMVLRQSVVQENLHDAFGGSICNSGTMTVTASTISNREARGNRFPHGIENTGTLFLRRSTVSHNAANGIVNSGGTLSVLNSTISGNGLGDPSSTFRGIVNQGGTLFLVSSTVSANHGGGLHNSGMAVLAQSIVAAQLGGSDCVLQAPLTSLGYNPDGDGTCLTSGEVGDLTSPTPGLGPLADNGGPTLTGRPLRTDQRGVRRPQGAACDIGAFEREALAEE
jgi:CSLREA domain-containing protein